MPSNQKLKVALASQKHHLLDITRQMLIDTISFLITKCYFTIGNLVFNKEIDIPLVVDPVPYLANLFMYVFDAKYVQQLISKGCLSAYKFHGTFEDNIFVYKLLDRRGKFLFFIVHMPYLSSNIVQYFQCSYK